MDDAQKTIFPSIVLSLLILGAFAGHSLEMEFVSLEQKAQLEREFNNAKLEAADQSKVQEKPWTCDMYGVRSRLQVQRNVKLYSLKKNESGEFANVGAQVVNRYFSKDQSLQGQNEKFEDQLRLTADGRLISRLSVLKPIPSVIAYSICKTL